MSIIAVKPTTSTMNIRDIIGFQGRFDIVTKSIALFASTFSFHKINRVFKKTCLEKRIHSGNWYGVATAYEFPGNFYSTSYDSAWDFEWFQDIWNMIG
jgi:hypothetical protein